MINEYKYCNISLTPAIFKELLIEFYDGKQFKRKEAIDNIIAYHQNKGGTPPTMEYAALFKAVTKKLNDKGLQNRRYGVWRLNYKVQETIIDINEKKEKLVKIEADKQIGEGISSVYVYYYDIYKRYAESREQTIWECKIGKSDTEPIERVLSQVKTSYPELPHIALIIRCSDSQNLEKAIHHILKVRGRWIEEAPGIEWFNTNPEEIERIYEFIYNDTIKTST